MLSGLTETGRLRMLWGIIATCTVLFVALLLFHHFTAPHHGPVHRREHFNGSMPLKAMLKELEVAGPPTLSASETARDTASSAMSMDHERRLRLFDEL